MTFRTSWFSSYLKGLTITLYPKKKLFHLESHILFINDLPSGIRYSRTLICADEVKISLTFDIAPNHLKEDLEASMV